MDANRAVRKIEVASDHELFDIGLARVADRGGDDDAWPSPSERRALLACALWLYVAYMGLVGLAAAFVRGYGDAATWPEAIAFGAAAFALTILCWRRARAALLRAGADGADGAASVPMTRPSAWRPRHRSRRCGGSDVSAA